VSLCLCTNEVCKKANKCARFRPEEERWNCYFPLDFVDGPDCKYFVEVSDGRNVDGRGKVTNEKVSGMDGENKRVCRGRPKRNDVKAVDPDGREIVEGGINV